MKEAVWASYYHSISTNEDPQHYYCPDGPESWCKWNRDPDNHDHQDPIPDAVAQAIKPVYEKLADEQLLEKCLHGKTQNANECFYNSVWRIASKTEFSGLTSLELAVHLAVLKYNEGMSAVQRIIGENPGKYGTSLANRIDRARVTYSRIKSKPEIKKKRHQLQKSRAKRQKKALQREGVVYAPGAF